MDNEQIKEIALANGFKLKEQPDGERDLNPYVYDYARALLINFIQSEIDGYQRHLNECSGIDESIDEYVRDIMDELKAALSEVTDDQR